MLATHEGLPFECTYHFVNVFPGTFVMLDVIRSPRGNSLRFFYVCDGKLKHHLVMAETTSGASSLSPAGDRITRTAPPLRFDFRWKVLASACSVAPLNPCSVFAITAKDHPHVRYDGSLVYEPPDGQPLHLKVAAAQGSISQHFGRKLPDYLYFNTYFDACTPHLVGALSRIETSVGFCVRSGYVTLTGSKRKPQTKISLRPQWRHSEDDGETIFISSRLGQVELRLNGDGLAHDIDQEKGQTWFNATVSCESLGNSPQRSLVESRGTWPLTLA